jgi:hypothetical protein
MAIKIGAGTSFAYSTNNGSSYTTIASIKAFTPNKISVAKADTSAFDNTTFNGNPVESCIPGWVTPGTYNVKLHFAAYALGHAVRPHRRTGGWRHHHEVQGD